LTISALTNPVGMAIIPYHKSISTADSA